jgi:hypothetical protein
MNTNLTPLFNSNNLNNGIFTIPGAIDELTSLNFKLTGADASYINEFGIFRVDDNLGNIQSIKPEDPNYAQVAFRPGNYQILMLGSQPIGTTYQNFTVKAGENIAFYLASNTTAHTVLNNNPHNKTNQNPHLFFSIANANPDKISHIQNQTLNNSSIQLNWEDMFGGGDRDFNDMSIQIQKSNTITDNIWTPISGTALQLPSELTETITGRFNLISKESTYQNEIGIFTVDDANGKINNLLPGDQGYAQAAINRKQKLFNSQQAIGAATELNLTGNKYIGFYLIINGTSEDFLLSNSSNQLDKKPTAYFSFVSANPDQQDHIVRIGNKLYIEDMQGMGDRDYNDLIIEYTLTFTNQKTNNPPQDIILTGHTIQENVDQGSLVGILSTIDNTQDNTHTYVLITGTGDTDNNKFTIINNKIYINESPDFETQSSYKIRVKTTNTNGLSLEKELIINITDLNEAPIFTSYPDFNDSQQSPEVGKFYEYRITTTDPENHQRTLTAALVNPDDSSTNLPLPDWLNFTDNGDGTAVLSGTPSIDDSSLYTIIITATDQPGITSESLSSTQTIFIPVNIVLREYINFKSDLETSFTIPQTSSILSFKIAPVFDSSNTAAINDALEVELLDSSGNSLVHTFNNQTKSFFNLTEGEKVGLGTGTTYDENTGIVTLNLTGINPGTPARLRFRLVNNDSDSNSAVQISQIAITPATSNIQTLVQSLFTASNNRDFRRIINTNQVEDVTPSIVPEYGQTTFNEQNSLLYADVILKNIGNYAINNSLLVAIKNISNPTVQLWNPDGFTANGLPYYDFSHLLANSKLDPNEISAAGNLIFYNPEQVQFTYSLEILAEINSAPSIQTTATTEIIAGQHYSYDVNATDRDHDLLTYQLLVAPEAMTIDTNTGLINWPTTNNDIGNQTIVIQVSDNRGGIAEQFYTLSIINPPPNRPPVFTSFPLVSASINTAYIYQPITNELDNDTLTFLLLDAPKGMTINPDTGLINWTPNGNQLGTYDVKLTVVDNRGGTAQQVFQVQTQMQPGNYAPIMISQAETKANTSQSYIYDIKTLDFDNNSLRYSLLQAPDGMVIDNGTGKISWDTPIIGQHNIIVQVQDEYGGIELQNFNLEVKTGTNFGEIRGIVWDDLDKDGFKNAKEEGLSGIELYLDLNENRILDSTEPTTKTNEQGEYRFTNLNPGIYVVREVIPNNFIYTTPQATQILSESLIKNGSFEQGPVAHSQIGGFLSIDPRFTTNTSDKIRRQ